MVTLWSWSCVAALAMGVLVWGLTFWTITFHRRKADSPEFPRQTGYNVPLELVYTAVPFICIAIMFYFTVVVQTKVERMEPNPGVTVDVTAFQWNWRFGYQQVEGHSYQVPNLYGEQPDLKALNAVAGDEHQEERGPNNGKFQEIREYLRFSSIETQGSSSQIPVLVLPTETRIQFDLASADVVHSFYVPDFIFKRDVMPNPVANHTNYMFQISQIDEPGSFVGRCAEMCGDYHAMMNFEIRAVTPDKFAEYIQARKPKADGGQGLDNAQALRAIGEPDKAITTAPFDTRRLARTASTVEGK